MPQAIDVPKWRDRLAGLLAEYRIPSAVVAILHRGEVIDFAAGDADTASGRAASTDTVYQCGSLTKTWTALAFMRLAGTGAVDLDAPVRAVLPEFAVADAHATATVTPRQLLNHTGGIEEAFGDPGEGEDVLRRMVEGIAGAPQVHPPGRTHGYSAALGYALLARIMEVVEGGTWDEIMAHRLFRPLQLADATTRPAEVDPDRAATGHIVRSQGEGPVASPIPWLPRAFGPGGNLCATAREVLEPARVLLSGGRAGDGTRIVSPQAIRAMMTSRVPVPDPYMFGPYWGLGLVVCDWDGHTVYAHDGSTIGHNARLRILPDHDLAITMLCNGDPREGFYKRLFNEILADLGAPTIPGLPRPDPELRLDPSDYVGVYERLGTRFEVGLGSGGLELTSFANADEAAFLGVPERRTRRLLPVDATHFLIAAEQPLEDTGTLALYDFDDGPARYLHYDSRVTPRASEG